MKYTTVPFVFQIALVCSALLLASGCGKKTLDIPASGQEGSSLSGGTNINYPPANEGYSESTINSEGTLDDTATGQGGKGNLSVNKDDIAGSVEYKKEHGRSSVGLSPIFFGFDQSIVRPNMGDRMANNALYLKQLPGATLVIEGNCDERGTNEYNLALGERRAINAKQYLINLGIEPERIRTTSYGEERPLFLDQDEDSYAQNRRADFILE